LKKEKGSDIQPEIDFGIIKDEFLLDNTDDPRVHPSGTG